MRSMPLLLLVVALLTAIARSAFAQNTNALINEALDKVYPLDLNTNLPVAMKAVGEQTGVLWLMREYNEECIDFVYGQFRPFNPGRSVVQPVAGLPWPLSRLQCRQSTGRTR